VSARGGPAGRAGATLVGVLSDTHGRLPDEVIEAFAGVQAIVHAGDVVDEADLLVLGTIAPVIAVRGNCDRHGRTSSLPHVANVAISGVRFLVGHSLQDLLAQVDPVSAGARVVVSGHTHRARVETRHGVLHVNPGSASGPRGTRRSVALLTIAPDGEVEARIVDLGA